MADTMQTAGGLGPDLLALAHAVKNSGTDHMVERIAFLAEKMIELADHLARPETVAAVSDLLDRLAELKRSGSLDHLVQVADLAAAAQNSLTDGAVEKIGVMVERLAALADGALAANIERALPVLKELVDTGALEVLAQWAKLFAALSQSLTDSAIERIAAFIETMGSIFMKPETPVLLEALVTSAIAASEQMQKVKPRSTFRSTMAVLADPDVQRMFQFFAVFAKEFSAKTKIAPNT